MPFPFDRLYTGSIPRYLITVLLPQLHEHLSLWCALTLTSVLSRKVLEGSSTWMPILFNDCTRIILSDADFSTSTPCRPYSSIGTLLNVWKSNPPLLPVSLYFLPGVDDRLICRRIVLHTYQSVFITFATLNLICTILTGAFLC